MSLFPSPFLFFFRHLPCTTPHCILINSTLLNSAFYIQIKSPIIYSVKYNEETKTYEYVKVATQENDLNSNEKKKTNNDKSNTDSQNDKNSSNSNSNSNTKGKSDNSNNINKGNKSNKSNDPIKWYGILVPKDLKSSQLHFTNAVDESLKLAGIKSTMFQSINDYNELYSMLY